MARASAPSAADGSVRIHAIKLCDDFDVSLTALAVANKWRAIAAFRICCQRRVARGHVGAYGIDSGRSCAIRRGSGKSATLLWCSSIPA